MRNLFNRQLDMLVRVLAFGKKYAHLFPPDTLAGKLFAIIAATIPTLSESAGSQAAGVALNRQGVTEKAESRTVLLDCLDAITQTARAIGRENPGVRSNFKMPRSVSDRDVLSVARSFADNAEPIKDLFLAHETDPGFIDELKAAITRFEESIRIREQAKGTQSNATAAIEDTIDKAMDAAYRLDGIVPNKVRKDYPALKEWEGARRVARARQPVSDPEPQPEPTLATTAAATQA